MGPQERYQSMAELRHHLAYLDTVPIPVYPPDVPPPRPPGDLPPLRTTAPILLVVFTLLAALPCSLRSPIARGGALNDGPRAQAPLYGGQGRGTSWSA